MNNFQGVLRRPNNLESALNTPSKELFDSDFQQDQRQKYERSEHSYVGSRVAFESKPSVHRDNKEIFDNNIPVKVKSLERDDLITYLRMQLLLLPEKGGSVLKLNLTDDSNQYGSCYLQPVSLELRTEGKRLHGTTQRAEDQDRLRWFSLDACAAFWLPLKRERRCQPDFLLQCL